VELAAACGPTAPATIQRQRNTVSVTLPALSYSDASQRALKSRTSILQVRSRPVGVTTIFTLPPRPPRWTRPCPTTWVARWGIEPVFFRAGR